LQLPKVIQASYIDAFKGVAKEVWIIATIQLINRSGMMVLPFLALYLTEALDWTEAMAATAGFAFGAGGFLSSYIGGWLLDRMPSFKLMLWSLILGGISFMILLFIESFYLFVFWIFITTTLADLLRPAAMGAVAEFSEESNLARSISLLRLAINLGIAVGPAIGGFLIAFVGYKSIFIVDGLTCILAGMFLFFNFRDKLNMRSKNQECAASSDTPRVSAYSDPMFLLFLFFNMIMLCMFFQILHTVPLFFRNVYQLSEFEIGLFFMMNGLLIFATEMPIIFALEKKKESYRPMVVGALLIGVSFGFLILEFHWVWISIILYNLITSFGEIINFPFISTLSILRSKPENKGSYIGLMSMMFSLAFMLSPLLFMPFIDVLGYRNIWTMCMVSCLVSGVALHLLKPKFEHN